MTTVRRIEDGIEYTEYESDDHKRDLYMANEERLRPSPTCIKCSHMPVCKIFGNMQPMMESFFGMLQDKDKPFKAEDVAKICTFYKNKEDEELR